MLIGVWDTPGRWQYEAGTLWATHCAEQLEPLMVWVEVAERFWTDGNGDIFISLVLADRVCRKRGWWWERGKTLELSCSVVTPAGALIPVWIATQFPWITFLSSTIDTPLLLQLPSETWYIFHELPRKRFFLVTDCMLKHWKMKEPNICFRKTQWKILSSSSLKLHQPECH